MRLRARIILPGLLPALFLCACVENLDSESANLALGAPSNPSSTAPQEKLTKHDAALRFLTAYVRLDRRMALRYADPLAVSKLDWNVTHRGNIPYYDDKMILHFNGGWARVYFQEVGGSFRVSNLDVHRR